MEEQKSRIELIRELAEARKKASLRPKRKVSESDEEKRALRRASWRACYWRHRESYRKLQNEKRKSRYAQDAEFRAATLAYNKAWRARKLAVN